MKLKFISKNKNGKNKTRGGEMGKNVSFRFVFSNQIFETHLR